MSQIYLPELGLQDFRLIKLERVARAYDERLRVGLNKADGNYCVFVQTERGTFPPYDLYPVLGLGLRLETLPTEDKLKEMIYNADMLRQGYEMLDRMNSENAKIKEAQEKHIKDAQSEVAVAMEWGLRRMSNDVGKRRVQVNMGEPVERRQHRAGKEGT